EPLVLLVIARRRLAARGFERQAEIGHEIVVPAQADFAAPRGPMAFRARSEHFGTRLCVARVANHARVCERHDGQRRRECQYLLLHYRCTPARSVPAGTVPGGSNGQPGKIVTPKPAAHGAAHHSESVRPYGTSPCICTRRAPDAASARPCRSAILAVRCSCQVRRMMTEAELAPQPLDTATALPAHCYVDPVAVE